MASDEYLKVEDVIDSLNEVAGEGLWNDIKRQIGIKRNHSFAPYKDKRNYENAMFQWVQRHCKGYAKYHGKEIFTKVSKRPLRFRLKTTFNDNQ